MAKVDTPPRFAPEHWVTLRTTGEHVKVESWSKIAAAYRVHSRKRGTLFVGDEEIDELLVHPDAALGRYWSRCPAAGCGAPLTPELPTCERCQALTCACGRCRCVRFPSAAARAKTARKRITPRTV